MATVQTENHELYNTILFVLSVIFIILTVDYLVFNDVVVPVSESIFHKLVGKIYSVAHPKSIFVRLIYVLCCFSVFYIKKPIVYNKSEGRKRRVVISILIIMLFLFGFSNSEFYNLFIYPVLLFSVLYASYLLFAVLGFRFKDENIFGVSNEKTVQKLSYTYKTNKGELKVHSAEQHMYVAGGSGAGKSDSVLKPTIQQHVEKDCPALIYDFKGNPMTLGKTAYTSYLLAAKRGIKPTTKLQFINFSDVTRSFRINFLSPRYIKSNSDALRLVANLLKNFNEEWRKKEDVWYRGAKAIWVSLIMRFINDDELRHKLNFPLLIELLTKSDADTLVNFIEVDKEAAKLLSPVSMAAKGSSKQFTGYITSANDMAQNFLNKPDMYYLLSEDEVNFDINNPEDPTFLCIASDGEPNSEYVPLIAGIMGIILKYFGQQGKLPTLFQIDEIYTIYLDGLPAYANTFRSNGICLQIGNQLRSMLDDMYGKEKSNNVIGACGTQFYGMGNDTETGKNIVDMLSDIDRYNPSVSTSDSSQSLSESFKRQKAMEIRDINGQPTGHFTGKIANGKPPYFSLQFERFKYHDQEVDVPPFVLDAYSEEELQENITKTYNGIVNLATEIMETYKVEKEETVYKEE